MRPIIRNTLCAFVAVVAAPAVAASDYFLKLGDIKASAASAGGGKQLEIDSFAWGTVNPVAKGKVDYGWKVEEGESAPPAPDDHELEYTIMVGKAPPPPRGVRVASGDVNGDGRAAKKPSSSSRMLAPGATKPTRGSAVGGAVSQYANDGDDAASGQATGKRQHKPLRARAHVDQSASGAPAGGTAQFNPKEISITKNVAWNPVPKPLDRGAVRVKVKFPWTGCKVGARYPEMTLGGGAQRYELKDAIITSCGTASSGGEGLPMQEVSFNYGKIEVRGWEKTQE